jgi:hypothetical protein
MRKAIAVAGICLVALVALAVTETPLNVKLGLWQIDMTLAYSGLPPNMQAMLDRMTAEQRAATGYGGTKSYHRCVTAKQLNTSWVEGDASCTWTVLKSTANDLEVRGTSCRLGRNQGMSSEVDVNIHVLDSEHVRASMHGTASGNGANATLNGNYSGKWLGASCPAGMN